jgi:hypothetical protein
MVVVAAVVAAALLVVSMHGMAQLTHPTMTMMKQVTWRDHIKVGCRRK